MRQKNRRRSLLTLYHHKHNDENGNENTSSHHEAHYANHHHLLHSDKSTYTALRFGSLSRRKLSNLQRPVLFSPEKRGFLEKIKSYVKQTVQVFNTYFYILKVKLIKLVSKSSLGPQKLTHTSIPLLVSGFGLLVVLGCMISPIGANGINNQYVHAVQGGSLDGGSTEETISPSISLSLPSYAGVTGDINLPAEEVTSGVGYITVDFNVEAKELDKYDVYVQSSNSSLIGAKDKGTIASISSDTTAEGMKTQNGKWGYSVVEGASANPDTLTYKPIRTDVNVSAAGKEAAENTKLNLTQAYTLAFAANLTGATADHYKSNIILSVAAGAGEVVSGIGFAGKTYMQEVDKTFCDSIPANTDGSIVQGQLIDSRDGNIYWVAKLADGLCWMTQNLDYGTSHYDPGLKILDGVNLVSVEDSLVYVMSTDKEMLAVTKPDQHNPGKIYYNAHYLVGNYYTWQQASLGTAGTVSGLAPDSVCPDGWSLPIGNQAIGLSSSLGSTGRLLAAYDISESSGSFKFQEYPMFFLRTGYGNSMLGTYGYYWTASTYYGNTGNYAYILRFNASSVTAPNEVQGTSASSTYMPVRCVAR